MMNRRLSAGRLVARAGHVAVACAALAAALAPGCGGQTESSRSLRQTGGAGGEGATGAAGFGTGAAPGAGGSATGGSAGTGGGLHDAGPPPLATASERVDLLLMVDNSISMADKQGILAQAVPHLVRRLVDPICVDPASEAPTGDPSSADGCDTGRPQFRPVYDIHVGVVTSSLGGHGGTLCSPEHGPSYWNETQNDSGHLIDRGGEVATVPTWEDQGFLSWDPSGIASNPSGSPGVSDQPTLASQFADLVTGAGERGCGYEASLEAWYRFLIDPEPPADVIVNQDTMMAESVGLDHVLLAQRAAFLRPDSLVVIIMLSDENDCSIQDSGFGYFMGNTTEGTMPRSTSVCDTDPNDPCCLSCIQATWPDGCDSPQADPKCQQALLHPNTEDRLNLRCWEQKRRFGLEFLYPTARYVNGLRDREVPRRDGTPVPNPLYTGSDVYPDLAPRTSWANVVLAGIIGVPWQDIATEESLFDPQRLDYLSATEMAEQGIWDIALGRPEANPPVPPGDPFMIESVVPREGTNPRTGTPIDPPRDGSGGNAINGHEYSIFNNGDLQYACIFPLASARQCVDTPPGVGCDCKVTPDILQRPLCDGTTQTFAKAYPGRRFLQVLRDYGPGSVVASICPKSSVGAAADPFYGYNPAIDAIVRAMRVALPE